MTLFIGGPFDGEDLPYNPYSTRRVRLPDNQLDVDSSDTMGSMSTADVEWPHQYEADVSTSPPVYRYVPPDFEVS